MEKKKYKPTVLGKSFTVAEGNPAIVFLITKHHLPGYFWVEQGITTLGYLKPTVWQLIDKKQWIIQ